MVYMSKTKKLTLAHYCQLDSDLTWLSSIFPLICSIYFRIQSRVSYWIEMLGVPSVLWSVTLSVFPCFSWSWQSWGAMARCAVRMSSNWGLTDSFISWLDCGYGFGERILQIWSILFMSSYKALREALYDHNRIYHWWVLFHYLVKVFFMYRKSSFSLSLLYSL